MATRCVSDVIHHKDFYLAGGDLTILVENHLYRIHSYFFERESLFFRAKLGQKYDGQGSTDDDPYVLEDIRSEDFARFLWVFYNPKYQEYKAPRETWYSVLPLASRWGFPSVKELAIRELEKIEIEPVEKIAVYHSNDVNPLYLVPSYISICKRDKSLTIAEGRILGLETVLHIAEVRERLQLQAPSNGIRTPSFGDFEDAEVEILILEVFRLDHHLPPPSSATFPPYGTPNGAIELGPSSGSRGIGNVNTGNKTADNSATSRGADGQGIGRRNTKQLLSSLPFSSSANVNFA